MPKTRKRKTSRRTKGGRSIGKMAKNLFKRRTLKKDTKDTLARKVEIIIEDMKDKIIDREQITPIDIHYILSIAQTFDEQCKNDIMTLQVSQMSNTNADDTIKQFKQAHDENFLLFYPRYNTSMIKQNIENFKGKTRRKYEKERKNYTNECGEGINKIFSQLVEGIVLKALKSIKKGVDFELKTKKIKVRKEDVRLNISQYDDVKHIIQLLMNHNKGEFAEVVEYIIPEKSLKDKDEDKDEDKNEDKENNLSGLTNAEDLLGLFNNNEIKNSNKPNHPNDPNSYDPFAGPVADITNMISTNKTRKNNSRTGNKKNNLSRLRSPSMKSMRNRMGVPDGR